MTKHNTSIVNVLTSEQFNSFLTKNAFENVVCRMTGFLSHLNVLTESFLTLRLNVNNLCHFDVKEWYEIIYIYHRNKWFKFQRL